MNRFMESQSLEFTQPLLGFEGHKRWQLVARPRHLPFLWLQSEEEPEVALPVVDPSLFVSGYRPRLPESMGLSARILCVVTRREVGLGMNLVAPIAVGHDGKAAQLVLDNPQYKTFHPLVA